MKNNNQNNQNNHNNYNNNAKNNPENKNKNCGIQDCGNKHSTGYNHE